MIGRPSSSQLNGVLDIKVLVYYRRRGFQCSALDRRGYIYTDHQYIITYFYLLLYSLYLALNPTSSFFLLLNLAEKS